MTYSDWLYKSMQNEINAIFNSAPKTNRKDDGICADVEYIKIQDDRTVVVRWKDGTVTSVRCEEGEKFDLYTAFCAALAKKIYGSTSRVKKIIDEHNVQVINARIEARKAQEKKEREERERINHERRIRKLAKRMRDQEEAKHYFDKTIEGENV